MILSGDRFKAKNVKPFFMSVSVTGGSYPYLRLLQPGRGGGAQPCERSSGHHILVLSGVLGISWVVRLC